MLGYVEKREICIDGKDLVSCICRDDKNFSSEQSRENDEYLIHLANIFKERHEEETTHLL